MSGEGELSARLERRTVRAVYNYTLAPMRGLINEMIILFSAFSIILYSIPSLKALQTIAEFATLLFLVVALFGYRLHSSDWLLIGIFILTTCVSFVTNNFEISLLFIKQFGSSILCLIYFTKERFHSKIIFPLVLLNILLYALSVFSPHVLDPLINISRSRDFNLSRFGGLFLNTHYSATFLAVFLIHLIARQRLYGIGALVVYSTGSKFVFVSYLVNKVGKLKIYEFLKKRKLILIVLIGIGVFLAVKNASQIIDFVNRPETRSLAVILAQVFDWHSYQFLLNPFPGDYRSQLDSILNEFEGMQFVNEIGLMQTYSQGGNILASIYLWQLFKNTKPYTIFLLATMLHYWFVLSPLIIYMMISYSRDLGNQSPVALRRPQ